MENIQFIEKITEYMEVGDNPRVIIGNCAYYSLADGNRIRLSCYSHGVQAEIINKVHGAVDLVMIPFASYFKPVKCDAGILEWTQYIIDGRWYFSDMYKDVVPTDEDYKRLADAIVAYMRLFD